MEDQNLSYKNLLSQKGFKPYLWAEFLAILTENIYKMTLMFLAGNLVVSGLDESTKKAIIGVVFMLPFLFFSGWGGYLADRYSKRSVLITSKMVEFFILILICGALYFKNFYFTIITLLMIMTKSAFMLPAKDGIIAEITSPHQLSRANGLVQMSTFIAVIFGTMIAGMFSSIWEYNTFPISIILIILGGLGWWSSQFIAHTDPVKSLGNFPWNPWYDIGEGFKKLRQSRMLKTSFCGSFWFWMTASLCQMNLLELGGNLLIEDFFTIKAISLTYFNHYVGNTVPFYTSFLQTSLAIGIGYGSGMAGFLSGDKVELGLIPLGALGISLGAVLLSFAAPSYFYAVLSLTLIGFFCGFFIVPLKSFVQSRSSESQRGRIMATQSLFDTCGVLLGVIIHLILSSFLNCSPSRIFMIVGISTLLVGIYVVRLMPIFLIRFVLWVLVHTFYRVRVIGRENVPLDGPALLVANHVSYIDGILVSACVSKNIRFLVYGGFFKIKPLNWLFQKLRIIPVRSGKDLAKSIERARSGLLKNEIVGIFAEGQLTRTGNMLPFKRGFEKIVEDLPKDIPIIPIYLDGLWWSIFSFEKGKFFFKLPSWRKLDITVCFGTPLPSTTKAWELRQAISELGTKAVEGRRKNDIPLGMQLIQIGRLNWSKDILGDLGRKSMTYGRLIIRSLTLASYFRKNIKDEKVAIYLEDSLQKAIVNIALNFSGKIAINLDMNEPISSIKTKLDFIGTKIVITMKTYGGEKFENPLLLEKIPKVVSKLKSIVYAAIFLILPAKWSFRLLCDYDAVANTSVTMVFKDGLTPLLFTNSNILAQTQSLNHIFFNGRSDLLFASLPFDTIDGLILGLWLPLFSGLQVIYGEEKDITGRCIQESQVTFLIASAQSYRKLFDEAKPFQLSSLQYAIILDGPMKSDEIENFESKFGVELLEGYSIPELSGFFSLNHKNYTGEGVEQIANKVGTIGQPIPGTCAKILQPETFEALLPGEKGILFVKSPGRAQGGSEWYNTKLFAMMDDAGFIILAT